MLVKVHVRGFNLSETLKAHADAKIRLMLGLYADKIRRIEVFLTDVNGPKGGEDMQCKIKVDAHRQPPIIIQEIAKNIKEAIDICAHRAKRSAARRFQRSAQFNRAERDMSIRFREGQAREEHVRETYDNSL